MTDQSTAICTIVHTEQLSELFELNLIELIVHLAPLPPFFCVYKEAKDNPLPLFLRKTEVYKCCLSIQMTNK